MKKIVIRLARTFPGAANTLRKYLPRSVKRGIGSVLVDRNPSGVTASADGRVFKTIPDRVFLQVIYDGIFEPSLSNFIRSIVRNGDTCVDIGANFGWFATLMAGTADRVIAYEPAARMDAIFRENVAKNDMGAIIDIRKRAVGPERGSAQFVIEGDPERESALGYVTAAGAAPVAGKTETVDIVPISEDLADVIGSVSLIKLDAEGFEHYAIQGGDAVFSADNPPVLITEANRETLGRAGTTREALCASIEAHGYTLYGMNVDGSLYPDNGSAPALACLPDRGRYQDRVAAPTAV